MHLNEHNIRLWYEDLKFQEYSYQETKEANLGIEAAGLSKFTAKGKASVSKKTAVNEKGVYELMIEEGFAKIPKQAITNFKPRENHTGTAYVTVLYYDEEDKKHCIAEDLPHESWL